METLAACRARFLLRENFHNFGRADDRPRPLICDINDKPPIRSGVVLGTTIEFFPEPLPDVVKVTDLHAPCWQRLDQPVAAQFYSFSGTRDSPRFNPNIRDARLETSTVFGITFSKSRVILVPIDSPPSFAKDLRRLFGVTLVDAPR